MDWEKIAKLAMQQRDVMAQRAHNLELDLAMAQERIAELEKTEPEGIPIEG